MARLALSLLLISVTAIWGWTFTVMKEPIERYGVVPFLAVRFGIASLVMLAAVLHPKGRSAVRDGWWIGIIIAGSYLLQTFGLANTSPTNCGMITGLFVIFAPLINWLLFRVPIPKIIGVAAVMSVGGLGLLTGTGLAPLRIGDVLTVGAAAGFGLHIACLDRVARRHNAAGLAATQFISATVVFATIWPFTAEVQWPAADIWPALVITSLLATALGFYIQTVAQQHLAAVRVAIILTMEPAFSAVFGVWLNGDRLVATQWLGAGIMLMAVMIAEIVPQLAGESAKRVVS